MAVAAVKEYIGVPKDTQDHFPPGTQLTFIGWEDHLLFCAPFAAPLPSDMPFQALIDAVLPGMFGQHPDFAKIDWSKVEWLHSGKPFTPLLDKTLAENGLGHKHVIRFRTPGLTGIKGTCT